MNFIESKSVTLDVLLHGSKHGMQQTLMQKIFDACVKQGHSVVNFNFPFFERGDENSSGSELTEEVETLKKVLVSCNSNRYKHIRLIGKSLGGAIGAKFLAMLNRENQNKFSIIIFGYITGDIKLDAFPGKITIIQGEKDGYGGINEVKKDLENATSKNITYFEIPNADHSFRNELKEPVYEDGAIEIFNKLEWHSIPRKVTTPHVVIDRVQVPFVNIISQWQLKTFAIFVKRRKRKWLELVGGPNIVLVVGEIKKIGLKSTK